MGDGKPRGRATSRPGAWAEAVRAAGASGLCLSGPAGPGAPLLEGQQQDEEELVRVLLSLDGTVLALNHELTANVRLLSPTDAFREAHGREMGVCIHGLLDKKLFPLSHL